MPFEEENPGARAGATGGTRNRTVHDGGRIVGRAQVEWLRLIARDGNIRPQAARLAIMIEARRGPDGIARFKVVELADAMGVSYATAYDTLHCLLGGGYLQGQGVRNRGCSFSLAMPASTEEGEA